MVASRSALELQHQFGFIDNILIVGIIQVDVRELQGIKSREHYRSRTRIYL